MPLDVQKKNQNSPQTAIGKVTQFKEKEKTSTNVNSLKDTGISIYEDFCKDTM